MAGKPAWCEAARPAAAAPVIWLTDIRGAAEDIAGRAGQRVTAANAGCCGPNAESA